MWHVGNRGALKAHNWNVMCRELACTYVVNSVHQTAREHSIKLQGTRLHNLLIHLSWHGSGVELDFFDYRACDYSAQITQWNGVFICMIVKQVINQLHVCPSGPWKKSNLIDIGHEMGYQTWNEELESEYFVENYNDKAFPYNLISEPSRSLSLIQCHPHIKQWCF